MPIAEVQIFDKDDNEINLLVEYTYYKGCRGARDSLGGIPNAGPPLEPDEDPEIEIVSVTTLGGTKYMTDSEEDEQIEAQIWEDIYED